MSRLTYPSTKDRFSVYVFSIIISISIPCAFRLGTQIRFRRRYTVRAANVMYITTLEDVEPAVFQLVSSSPGYIGFDLEKGGPSRSVATLQIATSDVVLVIQTAMFSESLPPKTLPSCLVDLLNNPEIEKVGVGIRSDAMCLKRDFDVDVMACVELSYVAKCVEAAWPSRKVPFRRRLQTPRWWFSPPKIRPFAHEIALAELTKHFLEVKLDKTRGAKDWTRELTESELDYAACDADAGYVLYSHLRRKPRFTGLPQSKYRFDIVGGKAMLNGQKWKPR
ncbi:hypothetical protein ACEPAF_1663 [Sanghuangporus sanghuang]